MAQMLCMLLELHTLALMYSALASSCTAVLSANWSRRLRMRLRSTIDASRSALLPRLLLFLLYSAVVAISAHSGQAASWT